MRTVVVVTVCTIFGATLHLSAMFVDLLYRTSLQASRLCLWVAGALLTVNQIIWSADDFMMHKVIRRLSPKAYAAFIREERHAELRNKLKVHRL